MIILVDCDDTIWNLCEAWVKWLNSHYGTQVKYEDIKEWDMRKAFPTLSENEIYDCLKDELFWLTVTPKRDAIEYLPLIEDLGHTVYFVTSANPYSIVSKSKMLNDWFPFGYDRLITTYHKELIKGDFMIDDYIDNFSSTIQGILFDANHNKNVVIDNSKIKRFGDWESIYNYFVIKDYLD